MCECCVNVDYRSVDIAEAQTMLEETALSSHAWRRHGLPGRPDGSRASLGDMLHRPEVTLDQVAALRPLGLLPLAAASCPCRLRHLLLPVRPPVAANWLS